MPLATEVLAGGRADAGLDMPRIERIEAGMRPTELLFGGDGTRSALATRASVAGRQHVSRSPRPLTGATVEAMAEWLSEGSAPARAGALERIFRCHHRDEAVLAAEG